jgi:hypothetical protein
MAHVNGKNRKRKISFLEERNTGSVPSEFHDSYKNEAMEKGEIVLPSGNVDKLQVFSDCAVICEMHKKKERYEGGERSLSELCYVEDNQDGSVLQSGNTHELQVFCDGDGVCKKHKKKKKHKGEESSVSKLHNIEDNQDENVFQSGNADELQTFPDRYSISKKDKKNNKYKKEKSLLQFCCTDENKNESIFHGVEDFERRGAEGLPSAKELFSNRLEENEAEEKYKTFLAEAADVTELPFHIIRV